MSEYELPENLPEADVHATEVPDVAPDLDVTLPDGAGAENVATPTLSAADAADEHFGELVESPAATSYVPIDLDHVRSQLDAAFEAPDELSGGEANGIASQVHVTDSGSDGTAGVPDDPLEAWWLEDSSREQTTGGSGNIGNPPGDIPGGGEASDDPPDPDAEAERLAARDETANLLMHLGRFTHGPTSSPLKVADDDSTISVSILTAGERAEDSGLTPGTVIGRRATSDKLLEQENFLAVFEAETLDEEIIPLVEDLDQRNGIDRTPIAHFTITVEPLRDRDTDPTSEFDVNARPTAGITVWVNKDLRTDVYLDANAMDRAQGVKVEDFLSRLGFENLSIPEADEAPYEDQYIHNVRSGAIRQLNWFVREQLG